MSGGVVVVCGGPSLSLGVVVCARGRCSRGWALSSVGVVVVRGAGRCRLCVRSLFVGLGCRLGVPCCRWWVLGVVEGRPAILWGWYVSFVPATLLFLGGGLPFVVGVSSFVRGGS